MTGSHDFEAVAEPLDLDALAATCEAATPGPWWVTSWDDDFGGSVTAAPRPEPPSNPDDEREWNDWYDESDPVVDCFTTDARYIATFDPPTVAALIAKAKERDELARRAEELVRLLRAPTCGAVGTVRPMVEVPCQLAPFHDGPHRYYPSTNEFVHEWTDEDKSAVRASRWTDEVLDLWAAVTSDGEVDRRG